MVMIGCGVMGISSTVNWRSAVSKVSVTFTHQPSFILNKHAHANNYSSKGNTHNLLIFLKKHTPLLCMGTVAARAHGAQMFLPLDNQKNCEGNYHIPIMTYVALTNLFHPSLQQ